MLNHVAYVGLNRPYFSLCCRGAASPAFRRDAFLKNGRAKKWLELLARMFQLPKVFIWEFSNQARYLRQLRLHDAGRRLLNRAQITPTGTKIMVLQGMSKIHSASNSEAYEEETSKNHNYQ